MRRPGPLRLLGRLSGAMAAAGLGLGAGCRAVEPQEKATQRDTGEAPPADTGVPEVGETGSGEERDPPVERDSGAAEEEEIPFEPWPFRYRNVSVSGDWVCVTCGDGRIDCVTTGDPLIELPAATYVQVDVSAYTLCGVRHTGKVSCASYLDQYHAGDECVPDEPIVSVAVASASACGILATGGLECWGFHRDWEGHEDPEGCYRAVVSHIAFALALDSAGELSFWGRDPESGITDVPTGPWAAVATTGNVGCALDVDRKAECRGGHENEPELDGLAAMRDAPDIAFRGMSGDGMVTCGWDAEGCATCCGLSSGGVPLAQPPPERFLSVDVGSYYSCGITLDDRVLCWADGFGEEYGSGTEMDQLCEPLRPSRRERCGAVNCGRACCTTGRRRPRRATSRPPRPAPSGRARRAGAW